jgi:hypothetical protein
MLVLMMGLFMNYGVEMGLGAMIYIYTRFVLTLFFRYE